MQNFVLSPNSAQRVERRHDVHAMTNRRRTVRIPEPIVRFIGDLGQFLNGRGCWEADRLSRRPRLCRSLFRGRESDRIAGMTQPLNIRPLVPGDHDQWLPLWDGYNAFYGRTGATALAPEITATTWARFFDPYEPMFALVADRDGRLLGLAHYLLHRSATAIAPSVYLQDLFTSEDARRRDVGRALINGVYAHARDAGIPRVWQTHETNTAAMRLYDQVAEKSGFTVYRHLT